MADEVQPEEPRIRPLDPLVDTNGVRKRFSSGKPDIDVYFRAHAVPNQQIGINRTHVATLGGEIVGYVTTTLGSVSFGKLTLTFKEKGLPRYPLPVLLIARLGVDSRCQKRGIGSRLVAFAVARAERLRDDEGCVGVTTDPLDAEAAAFYAKLGFWALEPVGDTSGRPPPMFLSLKEIEVAAKS